MEHPALVVVRTELDAGRDFIIEFDVRVPGVVVPRALREKKAARFRLGPQPELDVTLTVDCLRADVVVVSTRVEVTIPWKSVKSVLTENEQFYYDVPEKQTVLERRGSFRLIEGGKTE